MKGTTQNVANTTLEQCKQPADWVRVPIPQRISPSNQHSQHKHTLTSQLLAGSCSNISSTFVTASKQQRQFCTAVFVSCASESGVVDSVDRQPQFAVITQ
ncbi:hypothetical protein ACN38_g9682 [Penicillium nordicum]|uniref:Uncharacterized protein n=1 Tax=Penicillium nordicum TaxID=229535 RepID=A0A0M9WCB8_9EURO|nr:hypothetical protein ACN38_g9682 [Penicillium nordicum]